MKMVIETSRPIARVAKELGINEGTLGNWVGIYRREHAGGSANCVLDRGGVRGVLSTDALEICSSLAPSRPRRTLIDEVSHAL